MSSRKPSRTERKLAEERRRRQKRQGRALPYGPIADRGDVRVIAPPPGVEKMSEVIEEFMAPDLETLTDLDEISRRIRVGVIAWNLALLPRDRRDAAIDEAISLFSADASADARATFRVVLEHLIARKLLHFAENERFVLDFDVREGETEDETFRLSVISTMGGPPPG